MESIVEAWLSDLTGVLEGEPAVVSDLRVGVFYTIARLASGHTGVAFTPRDLSETVCCPRSAAEAPAAGRMAGEDAWALCRYARGPRPLHRAVGVAVLNALSALAMERRGTPGGRVQEGVDALDAARVTPEDRVALVGAFAPFIMALKGRVGELWVVDRHRGGLKPDELPFWRPPEQGQDVLRQASVAVVSGSALIEGGLEELLAACRRHARCVVLAGPTASPWPPTFFHRGVDVLGGIRVLDGKKMLQIVSEAGSGYFFEGFAEKVCILRNGA